MNVINNVHPCMFCGHTGCSVYSKDDSASAIPSSPAAPDGCLTTDQRLTEKVHKAQFPMTLQNSDTFVLYEMPGGKPDPHGPCGLCSFPESERPVRVLQAPYKYDTCWYYVMNFLRQRVGKNPCEAHQKQREIEVRVSDLRKNLAIHNCSLPALVTHINSESGRAFLRSMDAAKVRLYLENEAQIRPQFETPEVLDGSPSAWPLMEEFSQKPMGAKNMLEFFILKQYAKRFHLYRRFMESTEDGLEEKGKLDKKSRFPDLSYSATLSLQVREIEVRSHEKIAALYQMTFSSWKPDLGVTSLIKTLKEEGPLGVTGLFGKVAYLEAPFEMQQRIQGRAIFAWRPHAKRNTKAIIGHAVLFVGAKQEADKAYVYFIDPQDSSAPQSDPQKVTQRIYMISYRNFQESLWDLHYGLQRTPSLYAYRGCFLKDPSVE